MNIEHPGIVIINVGLFSYGIFFSLDGSRVDMYDDVWSIFTLIEKDFFFYCDK